jgi:V8-like Glu-specific endopeptidase
MTVDASTSAHTSPTTLPTVLRRSTPQFENFGATEAVATADGFLYKPKLLSKHAATVAVAAAKAAVEAASAIAQQQNRTAGTVTAKTAGLVSFQGHLPKDMTAEDSGPDDVSDEAGAGPGDHGTGSGPGPDPIPSDPEHDIEGAADLAVASARLRIGGRRRLQTVFSPDERLEMTNRQKTLVRAVGRVTFDINDRDHFCSGALIGPYTVLTAAHCVLSIDQPGLTASDWAFAPAINKWVTGSSFGICIDGE